MLYEYNAKLLKAVDGDTIDVEIDLGFDVHTIQRMRLARINTPEKGQTGYQEPKDLLNSHVGQTVHLVSKKTDKYGRYIAEITIDGINMSDLILQEGMAVPYKD